MCVSSPPWETGANEHWLPEMLGLVVQAGGEGDHGAEGLVTAGHQGEDSAGELDKAVQASGEGVLPAGDGQRHVAGNPDHGGGGEGVPLCLTNAGLLVPAGDGRCLVVDCPGHGGGV